MPAVVHFSSDVKHMSDWSRRTRIPLSSANDLAVTYARARRHLTLLKSQLVKKHGWTEASHDHRLLFSIETSSIWRSSVGLPAGPVLRLELPVDVGSFFSPQRKVQWEMVFHSDIFESVRKICPPVTDVLNLMQCLLTGVVTLSMDDKDVQDGKEVWYRTTRGLPPIAWVNANESMLTDIFGQEHFRVLKQACGNEAACFKVEQLSKRPQH